VLVQLKALHAELREAINDLAARTRTTAPDDDAISASRLRLAKLNRRRRALIGCILPLLHDAPEAAAAQIAALALDDARFAIDLSGHVGRWTMTAIRDDWVGYKRASAEMRASLLRHIDREAAVLSSLL